MNITHLIDYEFSITIKFGQTCYVAFYVALNDFDFYAERQLEMDDQWTNVTSDHLTEKTNIQKITNSIKTDAKKIIYFVF